MPLTSKEKVARFRAKLKADPDKYKEYLAKEKERDKKRRNRKKKELAAGTAAAKEKLKKRRENQNTRQALCRLRKNAAKNQEHDHDPGYCLTAYKSPQALGKALSRVKKALPRSPRKSKTVVSHLAKSFSLYQDSKLLAFALHDKGLSESIKAKVIEFFKNDDISWQAPGRKDFVHIITPEQEKKIEQKKIMLMTIDEAFEIFKTVHPDIQVGRSSFFNLRPNNIMPSSDMPHNVCVCRYHANMEMAVKAISQVCEKIPSNCKQLCENFVCSSENEECMTRKCTHCNNKARNMLYESFCEETLSKQIEWRKWAEAEGHMKVVVETGSVRELLEYMLDQLPTFLMHCFVKKMQQKHFQHSRESVTQEEAIIQIDFSENYTAKVQDEIQMLHWTHHQVTIFTAVVWVQNAHYSFVFISDDLSHGKHSVWVFLKYLIKEILQLQPTIKHVNFFSDGCAAQFKNKYTLSNLTFMENDYGVNGDWSFFASSHGKGAVDGVGGVVKRTVWNAVRTRKFSVTNAIEFAECAKRKLKNIRVIFLSASDIEEWKSVLDKRWTKIKTIQGTHHLHYFKPIMPYTLEVKFVASSITSRIVCVSNENERSYSVPEQHDFTDIVPGDFVEITLTKECSTSQAKYRAQVINSDDDVFEIKYLKKQGKVWIYTNETSWENSQQVLRKLPQPTMINSRGHMTFKK